MSPLQPQLLDAPRLKFDYSTLDKAVQLRVRSRAVEIHHCSNRVADDLITIGEALIDVKGKLQHGQFTDWLRIEFDMSRQRAQELMAVATRFSAMRSKCPEVRTFGASVILTLSAPSVSPDIVAGVLDDAKQGSKPTVKSVRAKIEARKPAVKLLPANVPSSITPTESSGERTERKWDPGIRVMCTGCSEAHADWIALNGSRWSCRRCGVIRADDSMQEWTPDPKLPPPSHAAKPTVVPHKDPALSKAEMRHEINTQIYALLKSLEVQFPTCKRYELVTIMMDWAANERRLLLQQLNAAGESIHANA